MASDGGGDDDRPDIGLLPHLCMEPEEHEDDDQLAVAVVPWWCLHEGVRVLPLDDIYGRKLARTKLVLRVQLRGDRLTDEEARRRANADERPPQQLGELVSYGIDVSALVEKNDTQEVSVISMKKSSVDIKEEAGYVRLTVKRKQGDAPCIVFFSTSDGTWHTRARITCRRRVISSSYAAKSRRTSRF